MNIVICEDDISYRTHISDILTEYIDDINSNAEMALVTDSIEDVVKYSQTNSEITLYYLDIELCSDMTGVELAARIRENDFYSNIIFITGHSEYMQTTYDYRVEALDYIIKDNSEEMKKRICSGLELVESRRSKGRGECLSIENKRHSFSIPFDRIHYIESIKSKHQLILYHDTGFTTFYCLLKDVEEKSDERFVRCHKSIIVNKDKIMSLDKKNHIFTTYAGYRCIYSIKHRGLLENDFE